jgi:superfamily I DNA/RNA helicase
MYQLDLSPEQEAILTPGDIVVSACPGAGKTRSIVTRFLERPDGSNKGYALLSFTNRAVFEAKDRCARQPNSLAAPNFVGTFDGFINRFIVTPWFVREYSLPPNFLRSWRDLPREEASVRISSGTGIGLWSFGWSSSGGAFALRVNLDRYEQAYLRQVESIPNGLTRLNEAARRKLGQLVRSGFIDSESARYVASEVLSSPKGELLLARLAQRFEEVIVDEAQDCDQNEFKIISLLRSVGVRTVVVADPDQSIYEFRGADQQQFISYRDTQPREQQVVYRENYRSSAPICALATSLRFGREKIASARSISEGDAEEIVVLVGSLPDKRREFLRITTDLGISLNDCIALAHQRTRAKELAGTGSYIYVGTRKAEIILRSSSILHDYAASYDHRYQALFDIERQVLAAFNWPAPLRTANRHRQLEALGKNSGWLRDVAARVLIMTNQSVSRDDFGKDLRDLLRNLLQDCPIALENLSNQFRRPSEVAWDFFLQCRSHPIQTLHFDTIHGAKGGEWEAVLLDVASAASESPLLVDWEKDFNSERRRVLYVGVTRAKKVIALSTCQENVKQLESILIGNNVPYRTKYC